jgi:hypothetical protein
MSHEIGEGTVNYFPRETISDEVRMKHLSQQSKLSKNSTPSPLRSTGFPYFPETGFQHVFDLDIMM